MGEASANRDRIITRIFGRACFAPTALPTWCPFAHDDVTGRDNRVVVFDGTRAMPLLPALRSFFRRHAPLAPGGTLVVAVSGGPDSLALLHALCALRDELGIGLHIAHLDHMLRGEQSAAEARFVAETAHAWGVPATVEAIDARALAREWRQNLHAAARTVRYAFLARVAHQENAPAVATAHHADDQAETVLANLLRGAGPAGLAGMRPVAGWEAWRRFAKPEEEKRKRGEEEQDSPLLLRPLLAVTKQEIEHYCATNGLEPRRDPSNDDRRYARTRIRHDLLPKLIEYNPRIVEALGRTAAVCEAEHAFVEQALDAAWPQLGTVTAGRLLFHGAAWAVLHPALRSLALRRGHSLLAPGETLGQDDVERALATAGGPVGRRIELPGGVTLDAGYDGGFVMARGAARTADGPQLAVQAAALPVPGVVELGTRWLLRAETGPAGPAGSPWEVYLDPAAIEGLAVRRRLAGDRMRPAGGPGSRTLQDIFVDAKIPRELRDAWPLVVSGNDIVWLPGVRAAAGYLAPGGAQAIHLLVAPISQ
jgi:tRNA(Ile)-lysidine synthetase-like protein